MTPRAHTLKALTLAMALLFGAQIADARDENLSSSEFSKLKKRVSAALKVGAVSEAASALEELATDDSWRAAEFLMKAAVQIDDQQVYAAAKRGLASIRSEEARTKMAEKLERGASDWRVRVLLCDVLAANLDDTGKKALIAALGDKSPEVQRAAIDGLKHRNDKDVVDALIVALEEQEGSRSASDLVKYQLRKALKEITGEDFATAADWKNFWEPRKDSFNFADSRKSEAARGEVKTHERKPRFFGSELNSNRIVFVIDVSGSMAAEDPARPDDGSGRARPETGGGADPDAGKPADPRVTSRVRIDRAKGELVTALKGLDKGSRFTVIAYNGGGTVGQKFNEESIKQFVKTWQPKLMPASGGTVGKAVEFVEQFQAGGATFTLRAIEEAFKVPGADTIILLSDGMPTEYTNDGQQVTPNMILDRVKELNKFRRVTIHTFGFDSMPAGMPGMGGGMGGLADFMKDLAEQNDGKFTPIR